jgi:hypothetical protein
MKIEIKIINKDQDTVSQATSYNMALKNESTQCQVLVKAMGYEKKQVITKNHLLAKDK